MLVFRVMHGWRDWLTEFGGFLNISGILVAMLGLAALKREFKLPPTPLGCATQWVRLKFQRSRPIDVNAEVATILLVGGAVTSRVGQQIPAVDASQAEWNAYLCQRIDDLGTEVRQEIQVHAIQLKDSELRRSEAEAQLNNSIRTQHHNMVDALAGKDGKGLDLAWWGLASAVFGTSLQLLAGFHLPS